MLVHIEQEVVVEVEGPDGQLVTLTVRPPNRAVQLQIDRATRKAYCEAVSAGYPTEEQAGHPALADDEGARALREAIRAGAEQLARADLPVAERRHIALAIRESRCRWAALQPDLTAEAVATQVQFETMLALCVYDASGRWLYRSAEHYRRAKDSFGYRVAQAVAGVFYGCEYPEEQFLREHRLAS